MSEGSTATKVRTAQKNLFDAAILVSNLIKSSLGPRGMDKMIVDFKKEIAITNDGATILGDLDMNHPAAQAMVEIAKTVDYEVGDGTTSTVVLAGSLLKKAQDLIDKKVHPTIIIDGYKKGADKALRILETIAIKVDPTDRNWLIKLALTSMASKLVSIESPFLASIAVDALLTIARKSKGDPKIDVDHIKIEKRPGGSISDSRLVKGIVLDKPVWVGMPKKLTPARIAIVTKAIEIKKPVDPRSVRININKPEEMKMYLERESKIFKNIVDKFAIAGANVVICQYGMDELVLDYFSKAGILGVRHVKLSDLEMLAKATGAKIISTSREVTANDLGYAKLVEERKVEIEKYLFFEGCKNPKSVTIFLRGGTQNVIEEAERSIHDALFVVKDVMVKPQILAGAGAPEMEIATQLKKWAQTFTGKEQLAIKAYAEAIEVIPETLAENAGMNSIDAIIELRAKHSKPNHKAYGVNVQKRKIEDARKFNVYEPLAVKEQVISAAMEAATMLLRINDVLMSSKPQTQKLPERAGAYEYGKADEYSVRDGYGGIEK